MAPRDFDRRARGGLSVSKTRLEAFSDGVFAIIITIMVLELKVPVGAGVGALLPVLPTVLCYVLSFVVVAIYWNNHHHMLQAVQRVNGAVLWANMHLLFWLTLVPFTTTWMGENHFEIWPVALYGLVLLMAACAYTLLAFTLLRQQGHDSVLAHALGRDVKGKLSVLVYAIAVLAAFVDPRIALALYVLVAAVWFYPDKRVERLLRN